MTHVEGSGTVLVAWGVKVPVRPEWSTPRKKQIVRLERAIGSSATHRVKTATMHGPSSTPCEQRRARFLRFRPIGRAQNAYLKFNKICNIKRASSEAGDAG